MKKTIMLVLVVCALSFLLFYSSDAQLSGEVVYKWESRNSPYATYIYYDTLRFDRTDVTYTSKHKTFTWKTNEGYTFYQNEENYTQFIDLANTTQYTKSYNTVKKTFEYKQQALKSYDWKPKNEFKQIGDYKAQKATATIQDNYGEYVYIAWFTSEISVPSGPTGVGGLPGLILELKKNGRGLYTFQSIEMKPVGNLKPDPSIIFTPVESKNKSAEKKRKLIETLNKDGN